jgi:uncharacterized RDD family membrane protein YckC
MAETAIIAIDYSRYRIFWRRLFAMFVDSILLEFGSVTIAFAIGASRELFYDKGGVSLFISYGILDTLFLFLYSVWMTGRFGQTIGKMVAGIKVLDAESEQHVIGIRCALYRDLPLIVLYLGLIVYWLVTEDILYENSVSWLFPILTFLWIAGEFITMFANEKRRAVHDLLAGSVVVKLQ